MRTIRELVLRREFSILYVVDRLWLMCTASSPSGPRVAIPANLTCGKHDLARRSMSPMNQSRSKSGESQAISQDCAMLYASLVLTTIHAEAFDREL